MHIRERVAQADPAAVGTPNVAAQIASGQIHLRRAGAFEIDPADVGAISVTAQIAEAIVVHADVVHGNILIANSVGRTAAAQIDPADVRGINIAGADVFAAIYCSA